jgi:hypothetical protein
MSETDRIRTAKAGAGELGYVLFVDTSRLDAVVA